MDVDRKRIPLTQALTSGVSANKKF